MSRTVNEPLNINALCGVCSRPPGFTCRGHFVEEIRRLRAENTSLQESLMATEQQVAAFEPFFNFQCMVYQRRGEKDTIAIYLQKPDAIWPFDPNSACLSMHAVEGTGPSWVRKHLAVEPIVQVAGQAYRLPYRTE